MMMRFIVIIGAELNRRKEHQLAAQDVCDFTDSSLGAAEEAGFGPVLYSCPSLV